MSRATETTVMELIAAGHAREDALQAEVDALKLALTKAERQFEFYANEHYRAGKYDKEKTNRDMANMLRAALKGAPHE